VNDPKGRAEMFSIEVFDEDKSIRIGPRKLDGGLDEAEGLARIMSKMYQKPVTLRRTIMEEWDINGAG
jgi:hypothetical protein